MEASLQTSPRGRVSGDLPFAISNHDPISIGSSAGCTIEIPGADPRHAELRWDDNEEAWHLHDDPAPGKTFLNDDPIVSKRLYAGDVIEIAGVRLQFDGGRLSELEPERKYGFGVAVDDLTVRGRDDDSADGLKTLLDGVSFQVAEGSFTAILGPSGCGKSTLIQRLAGFPIDGETSGTVCLDGNRLCVGDTAILRSVAYLPQAVDDTMHGDLSVCETMEGFVRCHLPPDSKPDFAAALDKVQLKWKDIAGKRVQKLSGGQKRRLALALELMRNPKLLLLDEPTAGLDPAAEAEIMELLRRISGPGKNTILCATHVLGSLGKCRDILVMAPGGHIEFHGTPDEALAHFGKDNWLDVYRELDGYRKSDGERNRITPHEPQGQRRLPLFGGVFLATLERLLHSVISSKWNLMLFAGAPLIVSVLLGWACGSLLYHHEVGTVYFCMVVAMFWFGISGTFRNLVSERVPKRCLDRMRGMPLGRYFAAHAVFALISAFVQSVIFVIPLFVWRLGHTPEFTFHAFPAFLFDLCLVGFSGGCVGLVVSAFAKKELYAAWLFPLAAVPALFLSKPVLNGGHEEEPTGLLRFIECAAPTLYPQTLLETSMERARAYDQNVEEKTLEDWHKKEQEVDTKTGAPLKDEKTGEAIMKKSWAEEHVDDVLYFFALMAGYAVVFLGLAFIGQNWRERQWDGR